MHVFFSGNRSITTLGPSVSRMLIDVLESTDVILVGDAVGVDTIIQHSAETSDLPYTVYYSGQRPRNMCNGRVTTQYVPAMGNGKAWHTCKDIAMSEQCDMHVGFVDQQNPAWKRSGTVANHNRVIGMGKKSYLYNVATDRYITTPVATRKRITKDAEDNLDILTALGDHMEVNGELWQETTDYRARYLLSQLKLTEYTKHNGEHLAVTLPWLPKAQCEELIALASRNDYEVNEQEPRPAQIPERVLATHHPEVYAEYLTAFENTIHPLVMAAYGIDLQHVRSIQLAVYEAVGGVSKGVFHTDADSDVTITVALNDDYEGGGLTMLSGGVYSETVHIPKQPAGTATIFRGRTIQHMGLPVTQGTRHLLVYWCRI